MRKRTTILLIALIVTCLVVFLGYQILDRVRTDTQPPEITLGQMPQISVNDSADALLQGVRATDKKDGDVSDSLIVETIRLLDSTGRANVSYAAFDKAGNVAKAQQEVQYADYISPRFVLDAPLLYRLGTNFDILTTIRAVDMIDGDIQHRVRATSLDEDSITAMGIHDVQFQVSNSLGDTVTMVFPVEVYDSQMYEATLALTDYLVYLNVGDDFSAATYLGSFTLGGKETALKGKIPSGYSLKTAGSVQTDTPGVYTVEYRLTYKEKSESSSQNAREYTGYSKLIVVVEG